jgi:hypothetical protein
VFEVLDRVYKVLTKGAFSLFPTPAPIPFWTRNHKSLGEILGTVKPFTFYHFLGAMDWRYSTGIIRV